ncbi:MAG: apolipoprotein N-acyltransferase [Sulfuricaulis sp.]
MKNQTGKKTISSFFALAPAWADAAALVGGLLLPLAFSPFNLYPLAVVSPALLFILWRDVSPGRAAWRGFLYGVGMFGLGVSWVYVSMHQYGNMPAPLAGLAVLLFVSGLSFYPAALGWMQARFFPRPGLLHVTVTLPALWVLFEWIRGWFLTGFPWLNLGYSQVGSFLGGYASLIGVYGVSLACALSAGLLAWAAREPEKFLKRGLPLLMIIWAGGWLAGKIDWVQPVDKSARVSLIQGNVPLESKWRPENRRAIIERYLAMSAQAPRSDLIVWPEAAVPAFLDEIDSSYLAGLRRISQTAHVDFLIGVLERDQDKRRYYNSVVDIGPHPGVYRKRHLVPFGEYPPLEPLFSWLMKNLHIPMSDFTPGPPDQAPLQAAGQKIGVSICYEDAFGEEVIRELPQATLLVNVSEDAWFGDSFAPHQRIEMARMRARETGRPVLRAANTGPSVVIDYRGKVTARAPQFRRYVLSASVQPMQGATPYVRFGNIPIVSLLLGMIALAGVRSCVTRKTRN